MWGTLWSGLDLDHDEPDPDQVMWVSSMLSTSSMFKALCTRINQKTGHDLFKQLDDGGYISSEYDGASYYDVKVNASVVDNNGNELELIKFYRVYAVSEHVAQEAVKQYVDYRRGNVDELSDAAKPIADIETEAEFEKENWQVIYFSGPKVQVTDVYKR